MAEPRMLKAALRYAQIGWKVFPCWPGTKKPITEHGFKDATSDEAQIRAWWKENPKANIAIATGHGLFVMDVDPRHDGHLSLEKLVREYGPLPNTRQQVTGRGDGGRHYAFSLPDFLVSSLELEKGVEVKGIGAYILAAPSIHPEGKKQEYKWDGANLNQPLLPAPEWLLKMMREKARHNGIPRVMPIKIPYHKQQYHLASMAGTLRNRGAELEEMDAFLQILNLRCERPGKPEDIRQIAESYARYAPGKVPEPLPHEPPRHEPLEESPARLTPEIDLLKFGLHDTGNAERIVAVYGSDLRYNAERKKWFRWDGQRWIVDSKQEVRIMAKRVMVKFLTAAIQRGDVAMEKFATTSLNAPRLEYALSLAQPELAVLSSDLDRDPWLLNFRNGTLDLRNSGLRPHDREDFITKMVPHDFDPDAPCPRWLDLLTFMTSNSQEMMDYLRRCFGYTLTGSTREKTIFFLFGPGGTGKTTLLTAFREALGEDYATLIQISTLLAGRENNATNSDTADLSGARFVMTSEPDPGAKLSPGRLKRLTQGMGKIKARRLYENPFTFEESHKLVVDCNDRPIIPNADPATFSRLHAIPCLRKIPQDDMDRNYIGKLREEASGILAWAVEGARRWYEQGLLPPKEVMDSVASWREECDDIQQFISERCEVDERFSVPAGRIFRQYEFWCHARREEPLTKTAFGNQLTQRFPKDHTNRGTVYRGLTVKEDQTNEEQGDG